MSEGIGMSAEETMNFIEGTAAITDALTTVRDQLIEKGWTVPGAEQVSILIAGHMLNSSGAK